MSLTLTNIPRIMRSKGWNNGARLMEIWFSRGAAIAPAYSAADTSTIRMDSWALTFSRARQVYDQLVRERVWANPAAQGQIREVLRRNGHLTSTAGAFGNLTLPVPTLDANYVNYRAVGFSVMNLDDMTAALGNFVFRMVVAGTVAPAGTTGRHQVTVQQVGVYVRDSYDFNEEQFLGFWDDSDNSVSMVNPLSGTSVSNADFRAWRTSHGRGGDFLVFSDLKVLNLTTPDQFVV